MKVPQIPKMCKCMTKSPCAIVEALIATKALRHCVQQGGDAALFFASQQIFFGCVEFAAPC
jgi:hypothetical protein